MEALREAPVPIFVEQRFPLRLDEELSPVRELYERAKLERWSPTSDIDWRGLDAADFEPSVREAASWVWSHRVWQEYTGLAETPALLIRFCLEQGREADPKYYLSVRNTEEAWHVEAMSRLARQLCAYHERPADARWAAAFNRSLPKAVLNAELPLDVYFAVHALAEDWLEHALFAAYAEEARHPVVAGLLARMVKGKARNLAFSKLYVEQRASRLAPAHREQIAARVGDWVRHTQFAGYSIASLAIDDRAARGIEAQAQACGCGLGIVSAASEQAIFRSVMQDFRRHAAGLGVQIPSFDHPRLGHA